MRQFKYPHCTTCNCPLIRFPTDRCTRVLCARCHEVSAGRSRRKPPPCACSDIDNCAFCKQRQYITDHRNKNREHINKRWQDYYYENWEARLIADRRAGKAYRERRRAQGYVYDRKQKRYVLKEPPNDRTK